MKTADEVKVAAQEGVSVNAWRVMGLRCGARKLFMLDDDMRDSHGWQDIERRGRRESGK